MINEGRPFFITIGSLIVLTLSTHVVGAEWTFTKGINAGAVYTDNVNLVSSGEESDISAVLTPHFLLNGKGARATVDVTGAIELNNQDGSNDSVNPRLQADAKAELVERIAFIDLNATATQNAIDPLAVAATNNLSNRGNTTTTYSYKISPYLKYRLKGLAETELRYTYNELSHSEGSVSDSSGEAINLSIDSGDDFTRALWGIEADHRRTDSEQGQVSELNAIDFRLGYQINRHWQVNGLVGDESNSFTSTRSSNDGSRWDIGAVWTPNGRTVLDFGIGERFFGSTKRLNLSHTSRRSVLTANYSEDLTNSTTLLSNQVVFPVLDPFGQPILDPLTGDPLLVEGDLVTINDSVFVDKRLAVTYSLRGRRTTLTVDGTMSEQVYQDSSREVSNQGLGATLSRALSGQLSGDISLNWLEQNESRTGNRETETWRVRAGLNQQLGEKTNLRFSYSFIDRGSNQAGQSYEENQLALTLMHAFD